MQSPRLTEQQSTAHTLTIEILNQVQNGIWMDTTR